MSILNKIYRPFLKRGPFAQYLTLLVSIYYHYKYSFKENRYDDLVNDQVKLNYYLLKHYHIVEKGLALPSPRKGFGQVKINNIVEKATIFVEKYGCNKTIYSTKECLVKYLAFNQDFKLPENYISRIKQFISLVENSKPGGTKAIFKKDLMEKTCIPFADFVKSRNSVRDFSDKNVNIDDILKAVELAKYSPSVCNRQSWTVHLYSDKAKIAEMLLLQNGNAGFSTSINKLLIVTGNIKGFTKFEHNQLFIDGGLFSMTLMLAIHSRGLGACPLNTCCDILNERKIKKLGGIGDSERLIMYIGVGQLKERYEVAVSERIDIQELLKNHS